MRPRVADRWGKPAIGDIGAQRDWLAATGSRAAV